MGYAPRPPPWSRRLPRLRRAPRPSRPSTPSRPARKALLPLLLWPAVRGARRFRVFRRCVLARASPARPAALVPPAGAASTHALHRAGFLCRGRWGARAAAARPLACAPLWFLRPRCAPFGARGSGRGLGTGALFGFLSYRE